MMDLDLLGHDDDRGVYFHTGRAADLHLDFYWTLWCGDGGEEIDVAAPTEGMAEWVGAAAIRRDYEPMKITRIERRFRGVLYL
jgi:hypothetical protein